ncbi:hypothetical protein [Pseudarthrobacter sp. BIM B-2242]|uniref:hypothetical protein n=1 Tax=Pseudarthrobacter sp. BIM B-2242 TaxID=2772401 RepID=UPI00168BE071|nr:hypothetical protein [Pseudarthrobacter sp. BIM B-2242]QOD05647.1 hypothetical protein IDT60_21635 [Pseudarthrobacter sp. BIM B-2242]
MPHQVQPTHPLSYWLSPELAKVSPPNAPSRLRELADTQGTLAAAWSSAIGAGPVAALTGFFIAALTGSAAWAVVMLLVGAALTWVGLVMWRRVRRTLPGTNRVLISRGPGSARGGIVMVAGLAVFVGAAMATALPTAAANGTLAAVVGSYLLIIALLVAWIVVPSTVQGRARESFRRRVNTDAGLRNAVERDLATWRAPYGNSSYGPL